MIFVIYKAEANRDAFAKVIYAGLFSWLVKRINTCLAEGAGGQKVKPKAYIGVLDIFGYKFISLI